MTKYGLLGYPLTHSFSRKFFIEKFEKENIKASFDNFELEEAKQMMDAVKEESELKGFCITIPHKQTILPFLDEVDEAIDKIGAVNCVKVDRSGADIRLKGFNTDVIGFEESFKSPLKSSHKKAIILGTGGASKAVEFVLGKLGIAYQMVSRKKTEQTLCYEDITPAFMQDIQVVVNTTPLGMYPKVDACAMLPYESVNSQHYFYDLVYNPLETLFLKNAREQGATTKCGMDMLELQAEANWRIWES